MTSKRPHELAVLHLILKNDAMSNHYDFDEVKTRTNSVGDSFISKLSTRVNTLVKMLRSKVKENSEQSKTAEKIFLNYRKKGERKSKNSSWCMLLIKERRNKNLVLRVFMFIFMFWTLLLHLSTFFVLLLRTLTVVLFNISTLKLVIILK